MLNSMTPFQSEIIAHYLAERKKRAKEIAERFATQKHGPAPAKQNPSGGGQGGSRATNVASTMSGSNPGY